MKTRGLKMLIEQLARQEELGFDAKHDAQFYDEGQLIDAAMGVVHGTHGAPENWNVEWWNKMIKKPRMERLAIAASFLLSEINREELVMSGFEKAIDETAEASKPKMYYIQKGYVGNACYFWRLNRCGYTTEVSQAHIFTEEEAIEIVKNNSENRAWPVDHILEKTQETVDSQYLDSAKRLKV